MIDHVSIQCADVRASAAFYDAVLEPLGGQRIMERGEVIGYGGPPMPQLLRCCDGGRCRSAARA